MLAVMNELQPVFSNLERVHVTKAKIQEAIRIIDDQTLAYELKDLDSELDDIQSTDDFLNF